MDTGQLEGMAAQQFRKQVIRECMQNDERLRELGTETGVDVSEVIDG